MLRRLSLCVLLAAAALTTWAGAQEKLPTAPPPLPTPTPTPTPTPKPTPPAANVVAATVNGQAIPELWVFRVLQKSPPKDQAKARKDILDYMIDNILIDQYLTQLKLTVEDKDVEARLLEIKAEAAKAKMEWGKFLSDFYLTEAELRRELASALRWDKFVLQQGTDKVLRDMYDKHPAMFDGSQVQARHILVAVADNNHDNAKARVATLKKHLEDGVSAELTKLPASADELTKARERIKILDKAFADLAGKESTCPSKAQGGDLGWFPRIGAMVEPFARTAFGLKPFQLSDPVATEFGYHLIMPIDYRPGKQQKYEDIKPFVQEVYGERLREAVIQMYKPRSKIEVK